jgi:membrane-associated phospholipid phosphatase
VSHGVGTVEPVAGDRRRIRYRSLPRALRRPALAVVVAAAFLAAALGVRYAGEAYPRWLDKTSLALARDRLSVLREPARLLIGLFDPVPLTVLIVVLTAVCAALGRWRLAVLAVAGPVLTGVLTTALKPVVERTKEGDLAYPSGHMGSAVALALVVALLIVSLAGLRRWAAVAVLVAVPAAVGAAWSTGGRHAGVEPAWIPTPGETSGVRCAIDDGRACSDARGHSTGRVMSWGS